ncbi:MAG: hypothetical protein DMD91_19580 [Candidatus Rokuibacteriota bacterium]|nr:MAG: hypothetical protein DMD91_19580 [Candidatus Rokubacteria bacterium]
MPQEELTQPNEPTERNEPAPESDAPSRVDAILHHPLTRVQALVGVCAGLITITGSVISLSGFHGSPPALGEMVAVVQDAREHSPLTEATVEILTPQDALVTTLTVSDDGRVVRRLKEGKYRVRVSHPRFTAQVRQIEVSSGERSELHVSLAPRPAPPVAIAPPPPPARPAPPPAPAVHTVKKTHVTAVAAPAKIAEPVAKPATPRSSVARSPQRGESP